MLNTTHQFWNARQAENFERATKRSGRIQAIRRMATLARPSLSQHGTVTIDLGCGTGLFAETVAMDTIIGIDFSHPFLKMARQRMQFVTRQSIFDLGIAQKRINHVVSLFVIDDYPAEKKRAFFQQVSPLMTPGGSMFFAAYSPNDERMGRCKDTINDQTHMDFTIYLESSSWYETLFHECGFLLEQTEILTIDGLYDGEDASLPVKREFILMVAKKP